MRTTMDISEGRVRAANFSAVHQPADVFRGEERPARVDVWRDVEWIGQWHWTPEGIGEVRVTTPRARYLDDSTREKLTQALRELGR